jgi:hypothetical protein
MKITILSQNLAEKTINDIANDKFTDSFESKPDVYVEFTQEDNRPIDTSSIIDNTLLEGYTNICVEALSRKQPFNVITKVYSNNSTIIKKQSGHVVLNTLATKGSSWVLIGRDNPDFNVLFINMHLPVDTGKYSLFKNATLGNKYRIESMIYCLRTILKQLKLGITNLKIFIGGDLNFRVIDGQDQLTTLLESNKLQDATAIPIFELSNNLGTTCKYLNTCDFERTDKPECLDTKRSPSRCDRILTNLPLSNLTITNQHNFVVSDILDHNAIIISVELNELTVAKTVAANKGGKRYKKTRRHRNKSRAHKRNRVAHSP